MATITFEAEEGIRTDRFLQQQHPDLSRNQIKQLLVDLNVNEKDVKLSYFLKSGDIVNYSLKTNELRRIPLEDCPPFDIVFEDEHLLLINKKAGQLVHKEGNKREACLSDTLIHYLSCEISAFSEPERAGLVHRLDRDTSGLMMFAKTPEAERGLKEAFREREVSKFYFALLHGRLLEAKGEIDKPIGRHPKNPFKRMIREDGKESLTLFEVIERFQEHSLVKVELMTGRTHQIRVHFLDKGFPLYGDSHYQRRNDKASLHLFSSSLAFSHPVSGKSLHFELPLPDFFEKTLSEFREKS